ncbi:MAG TPA: hypothetical protein VFZ66_04280 [Herpetosiphonaceae bacterium]
MFTALMLGSGVFWTLTYLLIIRQGARDHTYGMPLVALCANLSWEFIFAFLHPHEPIQRTVNMVWFAFDVVILLQLLRYGPYEFSDLPRVVFYAGFGLTLVTSFCLVLLLSYEFNDWAGAYAAFGQNLLMSVLFLLMLYRRRSLRGQSLSIGLCKLIGTALASLAFYLYVESFRQSVLLPFLYGAILVYDGLYVGLVYVRLHAERQERRVSTTDGEPLAPPAVSS